MSSAPTVNILRTAHSTQHHHIAPHARSRTPPLSQAAAGQTAGEVLGGGIIHQQRQRRALDESGDSFGDLPILSLFQDCLGVDWGGGRGGGAMLVTVTSVGEGGGVVT